MSKLKVITAPDPRLKVVAKPVEAVDDGVRQLMADMLETMYTEEGGGLAATQVGVDKRVIVMDINAGDDDQPAKVYKMANPEVFWTSEETKTMQEGCLSVPEIRVPVTRPAYVKVRYLDEHGKSQEAEGDDYFAACVQHEIDHLNGILSFDHVSKLKRDLILEKLRKLKKLEKR